MKIQPQYRGLSARLDMVRQTMPQLPHEKRVEAAHYLLAAAGRAVTNPHPYVDGKVCATLAGFKPAVTFSLPASSDWRGVESYLASLGFRYTNEETLTDYYGVDRLVRNGLIWSVATAGEMYGAPEPQLTSWISKLLQKNLPGHLLGYADDNICFGSLFGSLLVEVRLIAHDRPEHFLLIHSSVANDPAEAKTLAKYYCQGAEAVKAMLDWRGPFQWDIREALAVLTAE